MVSYLVKLTLKSPSPGPNILQNPLLKKGDQNMTPQNVPFWYLDYFSMKAVESTDGGRGLCPHLIWLKCTLCALSRVWLFAPRGLYPSRLLCPWDFPGKNTGVGCHFLLRGIFLTQGLNVRLLRWQADSSPLHHLGSPVKQGIQFPLRMAPTPFPHYLQEKSDPYLWMWGACTKVSLHT